MLDIRGRRRRRASEAGSSVGIPVFGCKCDIPFICGARAEAQAQTYNETEDSEKYLIDADVVDKG
jgi:hypothetical protein